MKKRCALAPVTGDATSQNMIAQLETQAARQRGEVETLALAIEAVEQQQAEQDVRFRSRTTRRSRRGGDAFSTPLKLSDANTSRTLFAASKAPAIVHKPTFGSEATKCVTDWRRSFRDGRTYLRNLKLAELSLVDRPANKKARIAIFKSDTEGPENDMQGQVRNGRREPSNLGPAAEVVIRKVTPPPAERRTFEEAYLAIASRESVSKCEAMSRARTLYPALLRVYRPEGLERVAEASSAPVMKSEAVHWFERRVDEIRRRDNCNHTIAMSRARDENPAEFRAYQQA